MLRIRELAPFVIAIAMGVSTSAVAIECARAKTVAEIAICSNPALKAFDEYLAAAYAKVRQTVPETLFQEIKRDQIGWIRARDAKCVGDVPCMIAETQTRTAALNGFAQQTAERSQPDIERQKLSEQSPATSAFPTERLSAQQIYKRAAASVVVIISFDRGRNAIGQGSGVVIASNEVATNCHVVQGAEAVAILYRGNPYRVRNVLGRGSLDYCILQTTGLPAVPASIGSITDVTPGQRVYTVGSPRGLELTIAEGLVSGLRQQGRMSFPLIQTSAAISPGSSGGGLFDEYGWVIGITTLCLRYSQNPNFALPVELFHEVAR